MEIGPQTVSALLAMSSLKVYKKCTFLLDKLEQVILFFIYPFDIFVQFETKNFFPLTVDLFFKAKFSYI